MALMRLRGSAIGDLQDIITSPTSGCSQREPLDFL